MLESMGLDTGIDVQRLVALRELLREGLPQEQLRGTLWKAGLTKTYQETVHV
jgi:hydroxymethylglutaryl-CoA lyase